MNYRQQNELQHQELEYIAKAFVLPTIKAMWLNASTVITGVKLASKVAGHYLGATHAPAEALITNQIAGFIVATTDKVYSAQLKALKDANRDAQG